MIFAGLPLPTLLAVFGAASVALVGLYLLKLRRRTVAVPFAPLWSRVVDEEQATRLFARLKRVLSLLLQFALLTLLVLALGDPRVETSVLKGRTLVVLVDASASMQATDVVPNRLGAAKKEVEKLLASLGGGDRMLLVQMDAGVTPLGPMTGDRSEWQRALDAVRPTDARADFPRSLRFAVDALRGAENPEIIVVSDGNLGPAEDGAGPVLLEGVRLSYIPVGQGKRNVGITQFSVRRYPLDRSRYEVLLEVLNTGTEAEEVELVLMGDGVTVDVSKFRLGPGERLPRFYPNLSGASRFLEARLGLLRGGHDDLAVDDRAYALLPERKRSKILLASEGNMYLEAALLLDESFEVTSVTPKQYLERPEGERFDAWIFDRVTPERPPRGPALYFDPRGPGSPVKVGKVLERPGFDKVDKKHPITRLIAFEDINVARGTQLMVDGAAGDKGIGLSDEGALLVAGQRPFGRFVALGFDLRESDFPLRASWPVFLVGALHWLTEEDPQYLATFRTGDVWRIPVGDKATRARVKGPTGRWEEVPVHQGHAVFFGERAGFYEVALPSEGAPSESVAPVLGFAANLSDERESRIAPVATLEVHGKVAGAVAPYSASLRRDLWAYMLAIAVVLTVLEWGTYHRRVTV